MRKILCDGGCKNDALCTIQIYYQTLLPTNSDSSYMSCADDFFDGDDDNRPDWCGEQKCFEGLKAELILRFEKYWKENKEEYE